MAVFKISKNERLCEMETGWNKDINSMENCNKKTHVIVGKRAVCSEHLPYVISYSEKSEYKDIKGNFVRTGRMFLQAVADYEAEQ